MLCVPDYFLVGCNDFLITEVTLNTQLVTFTLQFLHKLNTLDTPVSL